MTPTGPQLFVISGQTFPLRATRPVSSNPRSLDKLCFSSILQTVQQLTSAHAHDLGGSCAASSTDLFCDREWELFADRFKFARVGPPLLDARRIPNEEPSPAFFARTLGADSETASRSLLQSLGSFPQRELQKGSSSSHCLTGVKRRDLQYCLHFMQTQHTALQKLQDTTSLAKQAMPAQS